MHNHSASPEALPLLLALLLLACVAVSAVRLASRSSDRDSDVAHLLMNSLMAVMALDVGMKFGSAWLLVSTALTATLAARLGWLHTTSAPSPRTPVAVHLIGAAIMTFATGAMLTGGTGSGLALVLAAVVGAELLATVGLLLVGSRAVAFAGGGALSVGEVRVAAIPHLGMGIGMLAMLVGA